MNTEEIRNYKSRVLELEAEEHKKEIEEELNQEEREEAFTEWLSDNEETIDEAFIMTFNNQSLREWILEDEERLKDFKETFDSSYEEHLNDYYRIEMDCREVEE